MPLQSKEVTKGAVKLNLGRVDALCNGIKQKCAFNLARIGDTYKFHLV